jgi:phosphonate degradation associated HDIG domain protein
MTTLDELLTLYSRLGSANYLGEAVTQTEHGRQAAHFARLAGAADTLVIAALLHDVGHLLQNAPDDLSEWTDDAHHEIVGSRWLADRFGPKVSEPVRLHVPAKRYLCATDRAYLRQLSSASVHTLALQGGPMTPAEVAAFEAEPCYREAILLRRCDDQGKVAGLATPEFTEYSALIAQLAHHSRPSVDRMQ